MSLFPGGLWFINMGCKAIFPIGEPVPIRIVYMIKQLLGRYLTVLYISVMFS